MIQILLSGLAIGSIYALIAQGFYITWVTTKTLNFGQGDFLMIGAMVGYFTGVALNLPYGLAMLISILVGILLGIILERIAIRPFRADSHSWVVTTLSMGLILQNIAVLLAGRDQKRFPSPFGEQPVRIFSAGIMPQELFTIAFAICLMFLVLLFLRRSVLGKALAAVAHNPDSAGLMGINVRRMIIFAFALSSALASLGGVLIGPITFVDPYMGMTPTLKAFTAALVGGLDNPVGILIAGLALGVLESGFASISSQISDILVFLIIILVLMVRPGGLFAKVVEEKL